MGRLNLNGPELELVLKRLGTAYTLFDLRELVATTVPEVAGAINYYDPGGAKSILFSLVTQCQNYGILDRLLAAVADRRPDRPDLRALVLYLSNDSAWSPPLVSHGMALKAALERLTTPGNPFLASTQMAHWLIASERQVCQVRCGPESGTGFLVGPDLVLTCFHVVQKHLSGSVPTDQLQVRFDFRTRPDESEPDHDDPALPWLSVDPNWAIPHQPYSAADITLQGEPSDDELDFALLRLSKRAGSDPAAGQHQPTRGWVDLSTDCPLPAEQSPILIVQHPGRTTPPPPQMPLQIAFATPGFEGPNANGTRVRYTPSTLPGSSGSPVFGPDFRAVALHHNRGQIDPAAVDLVKNNRGIPLSRIRAALTEEVRDLLIAPPRLAAG